MLGWLDWGFSDQLLDMNLYLFEQGIVVTMRIYTVVLAEQQRAILPIFNDGARVCLLLAYGVKHNVMSWGNKYSTLNICSSLISN